jgi:glucosamine--fructose-6-phosphate aminotransferase (isomerizing)
MIHELNALPGKIEQVLKTNGQIAQLARIYTYATNFLYLGRGWNYPVALEGALNSRRSVTSMPRAIPPPR